MRLITENKDCILFDFLKAYELHKAGSKNTKILFYITNLSKLKDY